MNARGPIDEAPWPDQLTGHVAEPGAHRLHGYDSDSDLSRYYSFGAVMLLALTGELPDESTARAFEIASIFLSPVPAGEAPAHAAILARLVGAAATAIIGTAAIALAEEAKTIVRAHAALFAWLKSGTGSMPAELGAHSDDDRARVRALALRLEEIGFQSPIFAGGATPTLIASVLGVFWSCGLVESERIESALVLARLPCAIGEGLAQRAGHFKKYPMRLPDYQYGGGDE